MTRPFRLPSLLRTSICILLTGGCGWTQQQDDAGLSDLHNSVLHRLFTRGTETSLNDPRFPVHLDGLKAAQAKFLVLSIGIPRFSMSTQETVTLNDVTGFLETFRRSAPAQGLTYAGNQQELNAALENNLPAFTFALEGSYLLAGEPDGIDRLHAAGVRVIGIAHWFQNAFLADPSDPSDPAAHFNEPRRLSDASVLSAEGQALLDRMIERKIRIDVSHLGRAAFWEVVARNAKRTPLIASHANARALCDVPRNLDDEQIRAIARSGGLIGVCLHEPLLVEEGRKASIKDVVDHIDHLRRIGGIEHVAIGSDLEGRITPPEELRQFEDLEKLRRELRVRGYSPEERAAILWKNALHIFQD